MGGVQRIGIIGVGGFGRFVLEQMLAMPEVRVTAIAGTHLAKYAALAAQYQIPYYTTDWRALVAHPEVDVVYLATPPDLREEQAVFAAQRGKHIFVEKPLALTLAEADAMLQAATLHGVRVGLNFVMRYSTLYARVNAILAAGAFGPPRRLVFENEAGDLPPGHWFWDARRSGGVLVEHGVHFFDIFTHLLGPAEVAWAGRLGRPGGEEDRWQVVLRYARGLLGSLYHAFDQLPLEEQTGGVLTCATGTLRLDGWIPTRLTVEGVTDAEGAAHLAALLPEAVVTLLPSPLVSRLRPGALDRRVTAVVDAGEKGAVYGAAVRAALADFLAGIRDPHYRPRVTGEEGRRALALALEATACAYLSPP